MNQTPRARAIPGIFIGGLAAALLIALPAAVRPEGETKEWIFLSCLLENSADGAGLLRLDPAAPPSAAVSGIMSLPYSDVVVDLTAVPGRNNPTHLLAASLSGRIRKIPMDFTRVAADVSVGGRIRGCALMPPLRCYAVTHDWDGTTSSAALSFVSLDASQVLQTGVSGAFGHTWGRGLVFTQDRATTPDDPRDDTYRLFWADMAPIGITQDGVQMLQLTYGDALASDGSDLFNPTNGSLGPPFRAEVFPTQMNLMAWSRYRTVLNVVGCDDTRLELDPWRAPNGHDYVVGGRSRYVPTIPPTYATDLFAFDGSDLSRPGNVIAAANPSLLNGTPLSGVSMVSFDLQYLPAFHRVKVMNNVVAATTGVQLTSNGGNRTAFFHLAPAAGSSPLTFTSVNTFPGSAGSGTGLVYPGNGGCDGMLADFGGNHVYIGSDTGSGGLWRYPTVDGAQHLASATPVNPPIDSTRGEPVSLYTPAEQQLTNPPSRSWPLIAGTSVLLNSDPTTNFDGNDSSTSGGSGSMNCAAAPGATTGVVALLVALASLGLFHRGR